MSDIEMILTKRPSPRTPERVSINISAAARVRLRTLLMWNPEMRGVGYSAFIERACEVAETAIAEARTKR